MTPDDRIRAIVDAVLYEGYLLWPYRRSAIKNRKRWTFGGVYPEPYSRARGEDDPWRMTTECLLETTGDARVRVTVRFLQVLTKSLRLGEDGEPRDELVIGERRYLAGEEASEQQVSFGPAALRDLSSYRDTEIAVPETRSEELLGEVDGQPATLRREGHALCGHLRVRATDVSSNVHRLESTIENTSPFEGPERDEAVRRALVSTHTILECENGRFVSSMDPPDFLRGEVERCRNRHTWPVLVGEEGDRRRMLSSPVILYDYPKVAPESAGDHYDATEIDQLLALNVLALTDEEKQEMAATDPRAREILSRTAAMTREDFMRLHGVFRDRRTIEVEE